MPEALRRLGMKHLHLRAGADGASTATSPPWPPPIRRIPEGFYLAIELAKKVGADFILGTDPDSDRVGIMVRDRDGEFMPVTGNQTGVLLLDYLHRRHAAAPARCRSNPVAPEDHRHHRDGPQGGRGQRRHLLRHLHRLQVHGGEEERSWSLTGEGKVIMSYEESYGYMLGDYVRDKDAVTASLILTEMAAWYAAQGMTLYDALEALYEKYGFYGEKTHNLVMPGLDGLEKMAALMKPLRPDPPADIAGVERAAPQGLHRRQRHRLPPPVKRAAMELSGSNVLRYELADGTTILVRPSGTEPKIKVYILTIGKDKAERDENLAKYSQWVATLTK